MQKREVGGGRPCDLNSKTFPGFLGGGPAALRRSHAATTQHPPSACRDETPTSGEKASSHLTFSGLSGGSHPAHSGSQVLLAFPCALFEMLEVGRLLASSL